MANYFYDLPIELQEKIYFEEHKIKMSKSIKTYKYINYWCCKWEIAQKYCYDAEDYRSKKIDELITHYWLIVLRNHKRGGNKIPDRSWIYD